MLIKMYRPTNFYIEELVDPYTLNFFKHMYGSKNMCWQNLDERATWTLQQLRDLYGEAYVNTYVFGMKRENAGFRSVKSTVGAIFCQHRHGRAFDPMFVNYTSKEIRDDIRKNPNRRAYKYITQIERKVRWFHFAVAPLFTSRKTIKFITP